MAKTLEKYDVIIAGAGPAGASAAIHLANRGVHVLLVEQKRFPRPKLCGEFISPECRSHFENLGVAHEMHISRPAEITETVFYSQRGAPIVVPSRWFGGPFALGLSRAVMDHNLLKRAKLLGVDVAEQSAVTHLIEDESGVCGIKIKGHEQQQYLAPLIVDATGRARALVRKVKRPDLSRTRKSKLVAFKAHLTGTRCDRSTCEIYSYPGGYGGLSNVEDGLSNLCFIVDASHVTRAHSDAETVMRETVMLNKRAAFTLENASVSTDWLSVSLESFGRQLPGPIHGLLAVGDSAAFIDPFTGSGMLMALESGQLAAEIIVRHRDKLNDEAGVATICKDFVREYRRKFDSRLRVSGLVRSIAYQPRLAALTISVCGSSERFRSWLARATRSSIKENAASARLT